MKIRKYNWSTYSAEIFHFLSGLMEDELKKDLKKKHV